MGVMHWDSEASITHRPNTRHDTTQCQEVGPRFDMTLFQVKLGTMDQADAETEYVLRPYMNTAKKRRML